MLHYDLSCLHTKSTKNDMSSNINRCQAIHFSRKISPTVPSYFLNIDAIPMEAVVILNNLEILLDNILNFILHFDHIISRTSKSLGCIIKYCADFKNIHTIKVLRLFVVTWTYSLALTLKFFSARRPPFNLDYFHTAESSKSGSTAPHIRLTLSTLKNIF